MSHLVPLIGCIFAWWLSTGLIFAVAKLPRAARGWIMAGASAVMGLSIFVLNESAKATDSVSVYAAFVGAIGAWGFIETAFLLGAITGPRKAPCPENASIWRRMSLATATLLYHELAILFTAVLIVGTTWGDPNQTGTYAFLILMVMRLSAKLNLFFGVPNFVDEMMPAHLQYLRSYFGRKSFNWFLPVSIALSSAGVVVLIENAVSTARAGGDTTSIVLLATLLALAVIEHVFMAAPIRETALWTWAIPAAMPPSNDRSPQ